MQQFNFLIDSTLLVKGLRSTKRSARNTGGLIESVGAVGKDSVLASLEELSRIDLSVITDTFPFPQIFCFINLIIVCSSTTIYEWNGTALVSKLTTTARSTWQAVDFYEYVYLSNGAVAVTRSAEHGTYSTSSLCTAGAMLNFNGQVLIGSPDTTINGASLTLRTGDLTTTTSLEGAWA